LGVLLYELITGLPPHYNTDQFQMQKDIVTKEPATGHLSGDCFNLIKCLLEKNPEFRLGSKNGVQDIKDHRWFQDINWDDVKNKRYRYAKQCFMKVDMVGSNFNQELMSDELGIDVDEESGMVE
jgi:serine/threonine protein kinase